tara:strand:+ start:288 stop:722 length:435 start_codon:yes stop_codon:yes gene_type:complete
MTFKTKEEEKAYNKLYYEINKLKIKVSVKEYSENNKEKRKKYYNEYREKHREKLQDYRKKYIEEYKKTEQYIKTHRIRKWKSRGVICDEWDNLYNKYINTTNCEECDVELVSGMYGSNKKCLDHDHKTGEFRNVLCNTCNCRRR